MRTLRWTGALLMVLASLAFTLWIGRAVGAGMPWALLPVAAWVAVLTGGVSLWRRSPQPAHWLCRILATRVGVVTLLAVAALAITGAGTRTPDDDILAPVGFARLFLPVVFAGVPLTLLALAGYLVTGDPE